MFSSKNSISPQAGYTDLVLGVHYVCRRPLVGDSNVEQGKGLDHSCHPLDGQHRGRPAALGEEVGVSGIGKGQEADGAGMWGSGIGSVVLTMVLDSSAQLYFLLGEKLHAVVAAPAFPQNEA